MAKEDVAAAVREVLQRQQAQLASLTDETVAKLAPLLDAAQRDLEAELRRHQDSAPDSFTTQDYRVALARVKAIIQATEDRIVKGDAGVLADAGRQARDLSLGHLEEQIARFSEHFEGTTRTVNLSAVARTLSEVLVEKFETSVRSYGLQGVQSIQRELAMAQLAGRFPREMADRVMTVTGFGPGERWKAERIVRTELAHSYSGAHLEGLKAANEDDPGYQKMLVATLDDRTGDDSKFVNGQVRDLDEPFEDNEGRAYQHPPNRPNDREVEVATRPEWQEGADKPDSTEEPVAAEPDTASSAEPTLQPADVPPPPAEPSASPSGPVLAAGLPGGGRGSGPGADALVASSRPHVDATGKLAAKLSVQDGLRVLEVPLDDLPQVERETLDALTIWVRGDVPAVRDPAKYDASQRIKPPFFQVRQADGTLAPYEPGQERADYERAHVIITELATAPLSEPVTLFRGMGLAQDTIDEMLANGEQSSWGIDGYSQSREVSVQYAIKTATGEKRPVLFATLVEHGTDIGAVTPMVDHPELLSFGSARIVDVDDSDTPLTIDATQRGTRP